MRQHVIAAFTGLAMLLPVAAQAQSPGDLYWLELSFYRPSIDTNVRVSSTANNTIGSEIDFESDLDLKDDKFLPSVLLGARLSEDFVLFAEYYALDRSGMTSIDREITFDDVTYQVGATLSSSMDSDVYRLSLGWVFVDSPDFEMGVALGLHATDFVVSLSGEVNAGGPGVVTEARRRDLLAPLPTVGLFTNWEVAPRLTLGARADYLSLKIGDYDGRLLNLRASALYRLTDHFGLGAAWRYVDYRVDVTKPEWEGRVDYDFSGPAVFLLAGF